MKQAREICLQILMKQGNKDLFSNILLNDELSNTELSAQEKAFLTQLYYGVITNKISLDYIIKKLSKVRFDKIATPIQNILRIGLYQIYYLDKIPASAACNESVKLAKKYGNQGSVGFVNAILRNATRIPLEELFSDITDEVSKLSLMYSYQEWMIELFIKEFGLDDTKLLVEESKKVPRQCIRVNTLKISREELILKIQNIGIKAEQGKLPDILYAESSSELLNSKLFKEGLFTFQDEAAALVAHLASPEEGEKILDICAAPGGKTTHIAGLANDSCEIIAMELYPHRGELIRETARRLGVSSIDIKISDATEFISDFKGYFDKIIVDVPCSGLGVIRKKPDIKLRTKEEDITEINKTQKEILENAGKYLKSGGTLIYSTCTILKKENEDVVSEFLIRNKDFKITTNEEVIPDEWKSGLKNGMLTLLPHKHGTDGFFICAMMKE